MPNDVQTIREDLEDARDVLGCANPSSYNQLKDAVISGLDYIERALEALSHLEADNARLREALEVAKEAMDERRCYAEMWEYKYGETWDEEDAQIDEALTASEPKEDSDGPI